MACCKLLAVVLATIAVHDVSGQTCVSNKTCNGHGFCRIGCFSSCNCFDDYSGDFCQIPPICRPGDGECGPFGECNNCSRSGGNNFCQCNSGYAGRLCTIAPVCTDGGNECQNGGICNFANAPYTCTCPSNYTGTSFTCGGHHVTYFMATLILCTIWNFVNQFDLI